MYYNNTHALRGLGRVTARTQENPVKFDWVLSFPIKPAHRATNTMKGQHDRRTYHTVFMDTKTYNPHSRFERQANIFAVELLLPDDLLREYPDCTVYQLARSVGVPEELIELKMVYI